MRSRTHAGIAALAVILLLAPGRPVAAQASETSSIEQRILELQNTLDSLSQQMKEVQVQLDALRQSAGVTPSTDDLTAVAVIEKPAEAQAAAPPPAEKPDELATTLVQNPSAAGLAKALNPDISVIGNFLAHAGDDNENDERSSIELEEVEIAFEAFIDPYAKAKFFLAVTPEGAEMEEGYAQFIALPHDFTAKAGKMKASFGKVNTLHPHQLTWVDTPLVLGYLGEEGLNDSGISVSRLFPNDAGIFVEATGEIMRGEVEGVFEPENSNDLMYLAHLRLYGDISENTNLELGGTWTRGTIGEGAGHGTISGLDLTWRWKPLARAKYQSFLGRAEVIRSDRDDLDDAALGWYASADYQLGRRWYAGVRLDQADRFDDPSLTDRGASLTLTFWPSEFSLLRGQIRRTEYDGSFDATELLLQLNFSIGAHGAHTF